MKSQASKASSLSLRTSKAQSTKPRRCVWRQAIYAQAAARALLEHTALSAAEIVKQSLAIAGELCIYTNQNHVIEVLDKAG